MAFEEDLSGEPEIRSAADCLRGCPDLGEVDEPTLKALADEAGHYSLPAGYPLFEPGSPPDGVYLLVTGRLGVEAPGAQGWTAEIEAGEVVGEAGWLLNEPRIARVVALRDCEIVFLPQALMDWAAAASAPFSMAMARVCARRLQRSSSPRHKDSRARVFVIVPNNEEIDVAELATQFVTELAKSGFAELVWEVRASAHTSAWFSRIEEMNDYVVYVADPSDSRWTRQCCRQADVVLLAARARAVMSPWPRCVTVDAVCHHVRMELLLLHEETFAPGAARAWLGALPLSSHHHILDRNDLGRLTRLVTRRGVGLVLSGGGARGFAHLGVIRALREARVPIDFVGGASIGSIVAAGVAMGWSDEEMRQRYRRCFVDTNPVNDYTFPRVALTRGRKVSRLLEREYGDVQIEDLRLPFFCMSANLTNGQAFEHRVGRLSDALRASVAIPGVMPPVIQGDAVLVDGAAINNLPVDVMRRHAPGLVIGCDVGVDRTSGVSGRINIFQILVYAGLVSGAAGASLQRRLADVLLKPPLVNVDLLNWQAFDRAIEAGYAYTLESLRGLPELPRLPAPPVPVAQSPNSLTLELERRLARLAG